jgi:hypothetical protein
MNKGYTRSCLWLRGPWCGLNSHYFRNRGKRSSPLPYRQVPQRYCRITGLAMFDSEHSLEGHLKRHNNWESHPVLALEFCPKGKTRIASSDANWKSLGDQ